MQPAFVLVHSPLVGPATWSPVAAALADLGHDTVVPSLVGVADAAPPYWRYIAGQVADAINELEPGRPTVLVAHSNAGLFVPVLTTSSPRPVSACLFVDARIPALDASSTVPGSMRDFLQGLVMPDGRLPRWTEWWDQDEIASLFPDAEARAAVTDEQPRLPMAYFEQAVPIPDGSTRPSGYLWFGPPYDDPAADARQRGWLVEQLPGGHLHQVVDPTAVAERLVEMAARVMSASGSGSDGC